MKTVVVGPRPPELDAVVARRQALQQDRYDEVWKGDYHMAPTPQPWHGYVVVEHDVDEVLIAVRWPS